MLKTWLVAALGAVLLFLTTPAQADTPELTAEQANAVAVLQVEVATVNMMKHDGIITAGQAEQAIGGFLESADLVGLEISTVGELMAYEVELGQPQELTWGQKAIGALTFVNFMWTVAILAGAVFLVMFLIALAPVLILIPKTFWELGLWAASAGVGWYAAAGAAASVSGYFALTSGAMFAGAIALTVTLREFESDDGLPALFFGHAIICTILTVLTGGQLVGALAVASFMAAAGFSIYVGPLSYALGFKDEEALGRATTAAFLLLSGFVAANVLTSGLPALTPFEPGVLHIASFVGLLGLLIKASFHYSKGPSYFVSNAIFLGLALGMVLLGSVFDMPEMQKYAGTFFCLWLIEKMTDIPADSVLGYSFLGLVTCGLIGAGAWFVNLNVDLFAPYLFGL